jgi:streptomycin 6-kinase
MDEIRPGTPLPHVDPTTVTIEGLAALLAAMVGQPAPTPSMPSIFDWLRERLEDDELSDLAPGSTIAPRSERTAALRMLGKLATDASPGLCHADASPWNVLAYGDGGWQFIDPRGMSGEAAYDVATLGLKISRDRPVLTITAQLARAGGVDPMRAQAWVTVVNAARV